MAKSAGYFGSYNNVRDIPDDGRPQIAFAGRSNVGKSTLLNELVGRKNLAIVSKTPGRTRMINFFLIDERYFLVDLPGYGYARVPEKMKIGWGKAVEGYLNGVKSLNGLILLLDCRRDITDFDRMLVDYLDDRGINYIIVLTKGDKLSKSRLMLKAKQTETDLKRTPFLFSSLTGLGRKDLKDWIIRTVAPQ
jgi:GTP-binding protein